MSRSPEDFAIKVRCPKCGWSSSMDARSIAPKEAADVSVGEMAARVRQAVDLLIEEHVPEAFRRKARLALKLELRDDKRAAALGAQVVRVLMAPPEGAPPSP